MIKATAPTGNATLVERSTSGDASTTTVYDLYTDNGQYYFSPTESDLSTQVSDHNDQAGGLFAREIAAAKLATTGSVTQAAQELADAADPSLVVSPATKPSASQQAAAAKKQAALGESGQPAGTDPGTLYDNYVWENAEDAVVAGAGNPQVRAGVLRILATLPGVNVTSGTTDGVASMTLTGTAPELGSSNYTEQLTINASTGVPIKFTGGPAGGPPTVTITYVVSRVDTAHLPSAAGTDG